MQVSLQKLRQDMEMNAQLYYRGKAPDVHSKGGWPRRKTYREDVRHINIQIV